MKAVGRSLDNNYYRSPWGRCRWLLWCRARGPCTRGCRAPSGSCPCCPPLGWLSWESRLESQVACYNLFQFSIRLEAATQTQVYSGLYYIDSGIYVNCHTFYIERDDMGDDMAQEGWYGGWYGLRGMIWGMIWAYIKTHIIPENPYHPPYHPSQPISSLHLIFSSFSDS